MSRVPTLADGPAGDEVSGPRLPPSWSPRQITGKPPEIDGQRHPLVAENERLRAELTAAHAKIENLGLALQSSRRIGAAMGLLMAHRRITQEAAFDLLRVASQRQHRKLREIAEDVLDVGALSRAAGKGGPDTRAGERAGRSTVRAHPEPG